MMVGLCEDFGHREFAERLNNCAERLENEEARHYDLRHGVTA
jgi:hypothetical protein